MWFAIQNMAACTLWSLPNASTAAARRLGVAEKGEGAEEKCPGEDEDTRASAREG